MKYDKMVECSLERSKQKVETAKREIQKIKKVFEKNFLIFYLCCDKITLLVKAGMGGFPSGQRGQTVNLLAVLSMVRIHLRPFRRSGGTGRRTGLKILRD